MAELADGLAMKLCIGNRAILKPNLILPVAFVISWHCQVPTKRKHLLTSDQESDGMKKEELDLEVQKRVLKSCYSTQPFNFIMHFNVRHTFVIP